MFPPPSSREGLRWMARLSPCRVPELQLLLLFSSRETAPWHAVVHEARWLPRATSTPFTISAWICSRNNQAGPSSKDGGAVIQSHAGSSPSPLQPGVPSEAIKRDQSLIASVWEQGVISPGGTCQQTGEWGGGWHAMPSQGNAQLLRNKSKNSPPGSWQEGAAGSSIGKQHCGSTWDGTGPHAAGTFPNC